jgi:glycosyltransferase involved in cell wall biosynthesis/SAM-dependent methyltransferase
MTLPPMSDDGTPNPGVAFLLGIPRSGTTVLARLLDQHPAVLCPPEPWLALAVDALGQAPAEHPADAALLIEATEGFLGPDRDALFGDLLRVAYRRKLAAAGKSLLIDKTPRYYQCLDRLAAALPEAPLVWLVRNPLDVAASYLSSWGVDLAAIVKDRADSPFFADYALGLRRLADFSRRRAVHVVRYEDLVADPQSELAGIVRHLNLAPFDFSETLGPNPSEDGFGDRKVLGTQRLHNQSIGAYPRLLSPNRIAILLSALGPELWERLGYGEEYRKAAALAGGRVADRSDETYAAAERWLAQRRTRCRNAGREAEALKSRLAALETANWELPDSRPLAAVARKLAAHYRSRVRVYLDGVARRLIGRPRRRPLPRITLVTPVLNGAAHIGETLRSVLSQDYPDLEYLVVDGGSTDGTLDIVERCRRSADFPQRIAKMVSEPDRGLYDAVAKGFEMAGGEILGYLNADDLLEPGILRAVGEYFAAHPETALVYHDDIVLLNGWKFPNELQPEGVGTADLLNRHILYQDGVFFRREAYRAVGGMNREWRLAGDFDLWLRLSARFRFVRRPGHASCFRVRAGQLSGDRSAYRREMDRAIADFTASMPAWRVRALVSWGKIRALLHRARCRWFRPWRYFRIYLTGVVPPRPGGAEPSRRPPLSPVDGLPAARLLFSSMDTRCGGRGLGFFYLDERNRIAVCQPPPIDGGEVGEDAAATSPYRGYSGTRHRQRLLFALPLERLWPLLKALGVSPDAGDGPAAGPAAERLLGLLRPLGFAAADPLRILDVECGAGERLDDLGRRTAWLTYGLEPNQGAAALARAKGHTVWRTSAEDALAQVPPEIRFDVINLGGCIERFQDPLRTLRRLRMLLAPGGAVVIGTPNLDSVQIDWFGPTWAHWHPARHRHLFSARGLRALAAQAGMRVAVCRSHSGVRGTAMSLALNRAGVGGTVSPETPFEKPLLDRARRLTLWSRLFCDWRGRGDELYAALRDSDD